MVTSSLIRSAIPGSDASPQRLGPGLRGLTKFDHALQQRGHKGAAAGRRLRARPLPRRRITGPQDRETRREQAQGPLRANARHLYLCHQHDGRQGSKAVRVPDISEATAYGSEVRRLD